MHNRNSHDTRDKNRRLMERRRHTRRVIEHSFGSEQWIKAIQADYLLWPKLDRRSGERRLSSRRVLERRVQLGRYKRTTSRTRSARSTFDKHLLSPEEKRMLRELHGRS